MSRKGRGVTIDINDVFGRGRSATPPSLTTSASVSPSAGLMQNKFGSRATAPSMSNLKATKSSDQLLQQQQQQQQQSAPTDLVSTTPESAQGVAALLEDECREGNYECLMETVAMYHNRLETLERGQLDFIRVKLEADALRKACVEETRRAAEMTKKCNELQFRFLSGLGGGGGADDEDFDVSSQGTNAGEPEVQRRNLFKELGLDLDDDEGKAGAEEDKVDEKDHEAVIAQLKAKNEKLTEKNGIFRTKLEEQANRVLKMQETLRKNVLETRKTIELYNDTRGSLADEQAQRKAQTDKMGKDILELRHKVQSMEVRHRTDMANLTEKFQKKESMLAKTNQNLSYEVERLKNVERKLHEMEGDLGTAKEELKHEQAVAKETKEELKDRYDGLKENIKKSIKDIGLCFDALPLKMKVTKQGATPASNNINTLPSLMMLGELDLVRDLNGISSAIAFMAKILLEKMTPELVEKIKAERQLVEDIQTKRVQVNLLLAKAQVSKLGDHFTKKINDGVREELDAEERFDALATDVSLEAQSRQDGSLVPLDDQLQSRPSQCDTAASPSGSPVYLSPARTPGPQSPLAQTPGMLFGEDGSTPAGSPVGRPAGSPMNRTPAQRVVTATSALGDLDLERTPPPVGSAANAARTPQNGHLMVPGSYASSPQASGFSGTTTPMEPGSPLASTLPGANSTNPPFPQDASSLAASPGTAALPTSPGVPTFKPIQKGAFTHAAQSMESLNHSMVPEWEEMHTKTAAERLRNLNELEESINTAHGEYERKHLGGKKLPNVEVGDVDPKSKFGSPQLIRGRAGGKVPGKLISSLAQRKGLPGPPEKKQPKLAVKNSTKK